LLVSHAHRLIFMKTKKTAGSSIEIYLERACTGRLDASAPRFAQREELETETLILGRRQADVAGARWWHHMPAVLVRDRLGPLWDQYLKVCPVRNPFDKAVSAFWMQLGPEARAALVAGDFAPARAAFQAWIMNSGDLLPDRDVSTIDGAFCLDRTIRYETLAQDLEAVCAAVGLPWRPGELGAYKSGHRGRPEPFAAYYDTASAARVRGVFAFEIDQFGYPAAPDGPRR
jgi:hypothetical protein